MNNHQLKEDLFKLNSWYHKLIFIVDNHKRNSKTTEFLFNEYEQINLNLMLSEKLLDIPRKKYPLYIEEFIEALLVDQSKIYALEMIDILFDPTLQIHPIRLLENLSKTYCIIVLWPGKYFDNQLSYAEYGHPEYFICNDFEGKVYVI